MIRPVNSLAGTQRLFLRGLIFLTFFVALSSAVGMYFRSAGHDDAPYTGTAGIGELRDIRQSWALAMGETEILSLSQGRDSAIAAYAIRYRTTTDLATYIHDEAVRNGLDPELAFRLIKVESNFNPRARSSAEAFGLAQVQVATALHYQRGITEKDLYDPQTNLRIGFRYLRDLQVRYGNNMRMALLAYNVGPSRLQEILDGGRKPLGRYASSVLDGYTQPDMAEPTGRTRP